MEQLDFNLLFRWFVGPGIDDRVRWDRSPAAVASVRGSTCPAPPACRSTRAARNAASGIDAGEGYDGIRILRCRWAVAPWGSDTVLLSHQPRPR